MVFEQAEEHADHRVARDVVQRARFEEDVGLEEDDDTEESVHYVLAS